MPTRYARELPHSVQSIRFITNNQKHRDYAKRSRCFLYKAKSRAVKTLLCWCGKRDLNPYVEDTRPSNVRVCRFRHSREPNIYYYNHQVYVCQEVFQKNFKYLTKKSHIIFISFLLTFFVDFLLSFIYNCLGEEYTLGMSVVRKNERNS